MGRKALVIGMLLMIASAAAADDCTYPSPVDTIARQEPWNVALPVINKIICILNKMQRRSLQTPQAEVLCSTVTVAAGEELTLTLTASTGLAGTEMLVPAAQDSQTPPRLVAVGARPTGGAAIALTVMNHDAKSARSGKACVQVVRP